jgi:hypothetical protein
VSGPACTNNVAANPRALSLNTTPNPNPTSAHVRRSVFGTADRGLHSCCNMYDARAPAPHRYRSWGLRESDGSWGGPTALRSTPVTAEQLHPKASEARHPPSFVIRTLALYASPLLLPGRQKG